MGWMAIGWILSALLIAALVVALVRSARGPTSDRAESPAEILERRYARGEIDRETFKRMRDDLAEGRAKGGAAGLVQGHQGTPGG